MQTIGRYELIRILSRGGMATVHLARDPSFGREVAVKVLSPQFTQQPQFRTRFAREARLIAALEHPYIVPVYDYGEEGDQPFIVMRYMPGGTLADRIAGKPMPLDEVVAIFQRLAEALDEAHSQDIVHRDLKPSNVLFDARGHAFLSDFGIAKLLEESSTVITGAGVVGTPAYMSPEQAVGDKAVDKRSDVYALGVIVYEMLTGHLPYQADTPVKVILKHVTEPIPMLDANQLGVSAEWNTVLARALAKKPEERYKTAGELAAAMINLGTASMARAIPRRSLPGLRGFWQRRPSARGGRAGALFSPRRLALAGVPVLVITAVGVMMLLNANGRGKPTATATLSVTNALIATSTSAPSPAATQPPAASPTSTLASLASPTVVVPSPTASLTPTRRPTKRPPTATPLPPTDTATSTMTSTPTCPEGEYFDTLMNRCRPSQGGATSTPPPAPP